MKMENNSSTKICRFCLETLLSDFETIEEVTFANLDFLWLKLNLSISEEPIMCGGCAKTIRTCSDFKTKCLEIENYIVSSVKDKDSIKIDLRDVYVSKMSVENIVNVPDDHIVCRLCLELVKNDSAIFLKHRTGTVQKLEQYFPELELTCTEDPVICPSCQVALERYFSFINNCLTTEEEITEYCKVEGTNSKGQIELNSIIYFVSKNVLKCKFEVDALKIESTCNENNENASNRIKVEKEEFLHMKLDIKEDSFVQQPELTDDENSFQLHPTASQLDCVPQLTRAKPAKYACQLCGYQNNRRGPLQRHILAHKGIIQEYNCEICPFKTKAKEYLKKHMLMHKDDSEVTMYSCALCPYQTRRKRQLQLHMITHKDGTEVIMYKCDLCNYQTKHKKYLPQHKLIHMDETEIEMYKCEECPYKTKWKKNLKEHLLCHRNTPKVATRDTIYKCYVCGYEAKRKFRLKVHMLTHTARSEITMFKCQLCNYEAKQKSNLTVHMLTHKTHLEVTMYKCDLCDYQAKLNGNLRRHMLTHKTHLEVTMYKCTLCDCKMKRKATLKRHMLTHKTHSEITTYKCYLCKYEAKQKYNLERHMLIHKTDLEVTLYKCELCQYKPKRRSHLKAHMLTHKSRSQTDPHGRVGDHNNKTEVCSFEVK